MASESALIKPMVRCADIRFMRLFSIEVSGRDCGLQAASPGTERAITGTHDTLCCRIQKADSGWGAPARPAAHAGYDSLMWVLNSRYRKIAREAGRV